MPRLKESCLVLHNQSRDPAPLVCSKAAISYKRHRLPPELGHGPLPLHMDVRRFPAVGTEENEAVRSLTKYGRHKAVLLAHMFPHSEERFYAEKRKVATEAERWHCTGFPDCPRRRIGGECLGGFCEINDLHNCKMAPAMRTRCRSLIPTARIYTFGSGVSSTSE